MSAFVILDPISLTTPDGRPLFDCLTLAIGRERTGLVGRNGCGKSTLLRVIGGDVEPGQRIGSPRGSIGTLAQSADESQTVAQALRRRRRYRSPAAARSRRRLARRCRSADWTLEARVETALADTHARAAARSADRLAQRR